METIEVFEDVDVDVVVVVVVPVHTPLEQVWFVVVQSVVPDHVPPDAHVLIFDPKQYAAAAYQVSLLLHCVAEDDTHQPE